MPIVLSSSLVHLRGCDPVARELIDDAFYRNHATGRDTGAKQRNIPFRAGS